MDSHVGYRSQHQAARIAGFMFVFSFIVPTLNWVFLLSEFIDAEDVMATASNIEANQMLFRIGLSIELIMSIGLIVLASALYVILESINRYLALLALALKLVEAMLAAGIVLISFLALQIPGDTGTLVPFASEQTNAFIGIVMNEHTVLYAVPMVFLGLDMMIFFYLFWRSSYIPKLLAGFGILSFALIFAHSFLYILAPEHASKPLAQGIFYAPSGILEIVIGIWLLVRGLSIRLPEPADHEAV